MATLNLVSKYKKNTGLVLSPSELRDLYLYGINLKSKDGSEIPSYVWETKIRSAQSEIEKFLAIKLTRQLITETCSYYRDDYLNNLPIINTGYPVVTPVTLLRGFVPPICTPIDGDVVRSKTLFNNWILFMADPEESIVIAVPLPGLNSKFSNVTLFEVIV